MAQTISMWTKYWMTKKGIPFCFLEAAKSSNDSAKEQAFKSLTSPTVFLADQQIEGRGSKNKRWEDSDLMVSFLWEKNLKRITTSSCEDFVLDLYKSLKRVWPHLTLQVKAPNDLYLNDKKTAGILLEVLNQGANRALIVGLGLNVFSYPKNLKAACLAEQINDINPYSWEAFLNHLFSLWNKRVSFNKLTVKTKSPPYPLHEQI